MEYMASLPEEEQQRIVRETQEMMMGAAGVPMGPTAPMGPMGPISPMPPGGPMGSAGFVPMMHAPPLPPVPNSELLRRLRIDVALASWALIPHV